ncbi:MAG TPA: glycosyltransferase family 4 protein [bacterium]|nr:glycosyltransferase family 4 protein [bacterium]
MRDLVIDFNYPEGARWPPADERIRLDDLPPTGGFGLFRAVRAAARYPHYRRVYLACKDQRHVKTWLLLAALSLAEEVWYVMLFTPVQRITKGGLLWTLPFFRKIPSRVAAREFTRRLRATVPRGAPLKTGGVLLLAHSYPPSAGGIQTSMVHAAEGFTERGLPVRVLDCYRTGWRSYDADSPVPIRRVYTGRRFRLGECRRLARRAAEAARPLPGRPPSREVVGTIGKFLTACPAWKAAEFLGNFEAACRLISEGSPDTIHVGYCHPDSLAAMLLAAIGGWPYLIYAHGTETLRFSKDKRLAPFFAKGFRAAAAVLANAHYCAEIVERGHGVPPDRIEIIHPGVDFGHFDAPPPEVLLDELRRRHDISPVNRVLFIVGRVIPLKGFDTVLRALPRVLEEFPETVLLLGGDGFYLPRIRGMVGELGLTDAVRLLGRIPDDELAACYHLADLYVMPSRDDPPGSFEGFGIVFMEAGAAGTPQIGGRSGGIPDAVRDGETGLLCDPWDPDDLAEKILRLWRDPDLLKKLGEGARRWAAEQDWELVIGRKMALDERMRKSAATGEWTPPG